MTILAFGTDNKNMNLFDKKINQKSLILSDKTQKTLAEKPVFLNIDDMNLIASWVYQKGEKTQIYYKRIVRDFFGFYPDLSLRTTQITHLVLFLKTFDCSFNGRACLPFYLCL